MSSNKRGYRHYVVDVQSICIDSGWEDRADALDRAAELEEENGGTPVKVMSKPAVGGQKLDPDDNSNWKAKRKNPGGKSYSGSTAPKRGSGYTECGCRDCFDTALSADMRRPELCSECAEAGCEIGEGECRRGDAYDVHENPALARKRGVKVFVVEPGSMWRARADKRYRLFKVLESNGREVRFSEVGTRHSNTLPIGEFLTTFTDGTDNTRRRNPAQRGVCWKCDGSGFIRGMEHVADAKCFACHGTGGTGVATPGVLSPGAYVCKDSPNVVIDVKKIGGKLSYKVRKMKTGVAYLPDLNGKRLVATAHQGAELSARDVARCTWEPLTVENPGELLIVNGAEPDSARAEKVFEMWHRKAPSNVGVVRPGAHDDDEMVCIGNACDITYRSSKWEKGRKTNDYVHTFDSKPKVWMLESVAGEGGATKTVESLLSKSRNADGQFACADLAAPLSLTVHGEDGPEEIAIHSGARVYGAVDKRTVIIVDPTWRLIVIRGGSMHFDERGIVK